MRGVNNGKDTTYLWESLERGHIIILCLDIYFKLSNILKIVFNSYNKVEKYFFLT